MRFQVTSSNYGSNRHVGVLKILMLYLPLLLGEIFTHLKRDPCIEKVQLKYN